MFFKNGQTALDIMISKHPEDIAQLFVKVRQKRPVDPACSHGHLSIIYCYSYFIICVIMSKIIFILEFINLHGILTVETLVPSQSCHLVI